VNNKSNFAQLFTKGSNISVMNVIYLYLTGIKQSVYNVHQLQQHTTEVCCEMTWLP